MLPFHKAYSKALLRVGSFAETGVIATLSSIISNPFAILCNKNYHDHLLVLAPNVEVKTRRWFDLDTYFFYRVCHNCLAVATPSLNTFMPMIAVWVDAAFDEFKSNKCVSYLGQVNLLPSCLCMPDFSEICTAVPEAYPWPASAEYSIAGHLCPTRISL